MKKNPICTILWRDAAYSYDQDLPRENPLPRLTVGFIIKSDDDLTFIATNVAYDSESDTISPIDGFIIPNKSIIKFFVYSFNNLPSFIVVMA